MLKKEVTYEDLDGNTRTETLYFNLSAIELAEMVATRGENYGEQMLALAKDPMGNAGSLIEAFKDLLRRSYGERSEDGRHFHKSPEITEKFMSSLAFEAFFMELVTNPASAGGFMTAIMPKGVTDKPEYKQVLAELEKKDEPADELPWAHREPTKDELIGMSREQLVALMQRKTSA